MLKFVLKIKSNPFKKKNNNNNNRKEDHQPKMKASL